MLNSHMAGWLADAPTAHDDGHFISAKVSRIVELIRDYDPRLDVKWVPPEFRQPGDAAFAIMERTPDGLEHVVFYVDTEEEFNESVLGRVYQSDCAHDDVLARIEAQNKAVRDAEKARARDEMEEAHDLARSVFGSPLHSYKHNGKTFKR